MNNEIVADLAMGAIDSLETLKKRFPTALSFWCRVNGEVFGALPPDMLTQERAPKQKKTSRTLWDTIMGVDLEAEFKSLRPGETKTYVCPPDRDVRGLQHAFLEAAIRATNEKGWFQSTCDGQELMVLRRKVRVSGKGPKPTLRKVA
jgi:hypothetical protein